MSEPETIMTYDTENHILTINLKEHAIELIKCIKERYGSLPEDMDMVQESKCYEYAEHEMTEFLYLYIKDHWEELIGVTGLICPFCGSKDVVSADTGNDNEYYCRKCKKWMSII
jgi:hypothetical protein